MAAARAQAVAERLEAMGVRGVEITTNIPDVAPEDPSALWYAAVRPLGVPGQDAEPPPPPPAAAQLEAGA